MEMLTFFLFTTGSILLEVIIIFLLAIPTGLGLAIGLYYGKSWVTGLKNKLSKRKIKKKARSLADDIIEDEFAAAGITGE